MDYEKSTSDILFIEIRACERRLDSVNSRIKKLTKKKSPVRNLKLILPFVTSLFFLILKRQMHVGYIMLIRAFLIIVILRGFSRLFQGFIPLR